jgi:hypothetical protein
MSIDEARAMGIAAIEVSRPDVAADIARQMLAKDADDPFARFLLARALMEMGDLPTARAEARLAFRAARSPEQRHQAARLAAQAAWNEGRPTIAQYWLHRSAAAAPAEVSRGERLRELAAVRNANPVDLTFGFSAVPSDNVNDGASSEFNIIDGVPVVGWLSPDGQALPGVVSHLRAGVGYRLPDAPNLRANLLLDWRRVDLSSDARARVPDLDPRSFDAGRIEAGLTRSWRTEGAPYMAQVGVTAGAQMDGRHLSYRYLRLDGSYARGISETTVIEVGGAVERRGQRPGTTGPDWATSVSLGFRHILPGEDIIGARVFASHFDTPVFGRSSLSLGFDVTYRRAKPIGPAMLFARAGYAETRFDDYMVGFITVPGGRQDQTFSAGLSLSFPKQEFWGFTPALSITHRETRSNVSRFETKRSGVSLGLAAQF